MIQNKELRMQDIEQNQDKEQRIENEDKNKNK